MKDNNKQQIHKEIVMPIVTDGHLIKAWRKQVGDRVNKGDPIVEVNGRTIYAPFEGQIVEITKSEKTEVNADEVIAVMECDIPNDYQLEKVTIRDLLPEDTVIDGTNYNYTINWLINEGSFIRVGDNIAKAYYGVNEEYINLQMPKRGHLIKKIVSETDEIGLNDIIAYLELEKNDGINIKETSYTKELPKESMIIPLSYNTSSILSDDGDTHMSDTKNNDNLSNTNKQESTSLDALIDELPDSLPELAVFSNQTLPTNNDLTMQKSNEIEMVESVESESQQDKSKIIDDHKPAKLSNEDSQQNQQEEDNVTRPLTEESLQDLQVDSKGCYAVILGLSGTGKSTCLEVIGDALSNINNVDRGSTAPGNINILTIHRRNNENVFLVDTAGENFRAWLHHQCGIQINDIGTFFENVDIANGQKNDEIENNQNFLALFHKLILGAAHLYFIIPAPPEGGVVNRVNECVTRLRQHIPKFSNRLNIFVNKLDETNYIQNTRKYCWLNDEEDIFEALLSYKDDDNYDAHTRDLLPSAIININQNIVKNFIDGYISLVYGDGDQIQINRENRITHTINNNAIIKINYLEKLQTNAAINTAYSYNIIYLLYPPLLIIKRKIVELINDIEKNDQWNDDIKKGKAIAHLTLLAQHITDFAPNFNVLTHPYNQACTDFNNLIQQAFNFEGLRIPYLKTQINKLENEIIDIEDKKQKQLDNLTAMVQGDNLTKAELNSRVTKTNKNLIDLSGYDPSSTAYSQVMSQAQNIIDAQKINE